jgi:hypothetical protein
VFGLPNRCAWSRCELIGLKKPDAVSEGTCVLLTESGGLCGLLEVAVLLPPPTEPVGVCPVSCTGPAICEYPLGADVGCEEFGRETGKMAELGLELATSSERADDMTLTAVEGRLAIFQEQPWTVASNRCSLGVSCLRGSPRP